MKRSFSIFIVLIFISLLSGCLLSKTPSTSDVNMTSGEEKTFSVNVFPSNSTYTWTLDTSPPSTGGKSYSYTAMPGDHTLTVKAKHICGTDTQTWKITVNGWDLSTDWSDTFNPNGPWSYNEGPHIPITVHWDDWDTLNSFFADDQPAWSRAQYPYHEHIPCWFKVGSNPGPTALDIPVGKVGMHSTSWCGGSEVTTEASVDWTSPITGRIKISGGVWLAMDLGRPQDWTLYFNDVPISGGSLYDSDPYSSVNPFDFKNGSGGESVLERDVVVGDIITLELRKAPSAPCGWFSGVNMSIINQ